MSQDRKQQVEDARVVEEAVLVHVDAEIRRRPDDESPRAKAIDTALTLGRQLIQARIDAYGLLLDRLEVEKSRAVLPGLTGR